MKWMSQLVVHHFLFQVCTVKLYYNQVPIRLSLRADWIDLGGPQALLTVQSYSVQLTEEMCERTVVTLAWGPQSYEEQSV